MSLTLGQLDARLARRLGDTNDSVWDSDDRLQALTEACEEAWDSDFFVIVEDFTTYTGASSIAINTAEIAVPSGFLPTASTTAVAAAGLVSAIEVRETGTLTYTEPIGARWHFVEDGVMVDDLSLTSPKIRFANPWNIITEIRLYGGVPIVCPASTSAAMPNSDHAGFVSWLLTTASWKCYEMRVTRDGEDQRAYFKRMVMAQQTAKEIKGKSRMTFPHLTAFKWSS